MLPLRALSDTSRHKCIPMQKSKKSCVWFKVYSQGVLRSQELTHFYPIEIKSAAKMEYFTHWALHGESILLALVYIILTLELADSWKLFQCGV